MKTGKKGHFLAMVFSGAIGNTMEWYDFAVYGYMAPILSDVFFPSDDVLVSLMATFGVFAAGFIMRPLGGVIFGYIGDKKGRRVVLIASVVLMTLSTMFIGFLPTTLAIGSWGAISLVLLRLIQGLSVGGEFSGSVTLLVEAAPQDKRGLFGSFANIGCLMGMLIGVGVSTAMTVSFSHAFMLSWGWRIPFLLAGIIGIFAIYLTHHLPESVIFLHNKKHQNASPLVETFKNNKIEFCQALLFCIGYAIIFYVPLVYLPTYANKVLGMQLSHSLALTTVATAVVIPFIILFAYLSDRVIKRVSLLRAAFFLVLIMSVPLFIYFVHTKTLLAFSFVLFSFSIFTAVPLGSAPATLTELFPTGDRLTGYSVAYNVGLGIFGGLTPLVITWLIQQSDDKLVPAYYLAAAAFIALIGLVWMKDRSRQPLP